ncbi:hypothetical protein BT69DRAFT_1296238 [Atractiella rhizophila]|nr:hypothetical protein BT69DRAFT_1296238 [Atractiella rhizophila]
MVISEMSATDREQIKSQLSEQLQAPASSAPPPKDAASPPPELCQKVEEGKATDEEVARVLQGGSSYKEQLVETLAGKLEESKKLHEESLELQKQAESSSDPKEAAKLRFQAQEKEKKAKSLIKQVHRAQTGVVQGAGGGAGIGAGIAGGLGAAVGSLLGGIVAIPTTALGLLVGAGVGVVHGPWVKLVEATVKEEEEGKKDGEEGIGEEKETQTEDVEERQVEKEEVEDSSKGEVKEGGAAELVEKK